MVAEGTEPVRAKIRLGVTLWGAPVECDSTPMGWATVSSRAAGFRACRTCDVLLPPMRSRNGWRRRHLVYLSYQHRHFNRQPRMALRGMRIPARRHDRVGFPSTIWRTNMPMHHINHFAVEVAHG